MQEYLDACFASDLSNAFLMNALAPTMTEGIEDDPRAEIGKLMKDCRGRNAKLIDGTRGEETMAKLTASLMEIDNTPSSDNVEVTSEPRNVFRVWGLCDAGQIWRIAI